MAKQPRKHHYVPQFYLAGFTQNGRQDGRLYVLDRSEKTQRPSSPENTAHQRDYHAVALGPSVDRMGVEKALATVEGQQAAVLRRVLGEQDLPPEDDEAIADLMAFVALMAVRIPRFRELVSDFIDRAEKAQARAMFASEAGRASFTAAMDALLPTLGPLKRKEVENFLADDPDLAKMAEFVNSDSYRISYGRDEQDRTWDVQTMLRMSIVLIPVLAERYWSLWLVSDNGPDLVCSDSPVYLGWTKQVSGLYPPGFGVPQTIVTVPLSRRVALVGMFEPLPKRRDIGEAEVARLNLSTVMYGSVVYSAEPDFVWLTSDGKIGNKQDLLGSDDANS